MAPSSLDVDAHPTVFISYSHDSPEHQQRVLALANQLRGDGINAWIDAYRPDPDEGWIVWIRQQIQKADKVLLVFTEGYSKLFLGNEEQDRDPTTTFQGLIVTGELYERGIYNSKFRPVIFRPEDEQFITTELRRFKRYLLNTPENYTELLGWVYGHVPLLPEIGPPPIFDSQVPPELLSRNLEENHTSKTIISEMSSPDASDRQDLANFRELVKKKLIKDRFEKSLFRKMLIELSIEERPDAIEDPVDLVVVRPDRTSQRLAPGTRVFDVYHEHGSLLILGKPGSGKTTTLLDLTRSLLEQVQSDSNKPVPVVLNLSTWNNKQSSFLEWAVMTLKTVWGVPPSQAQRWLADRRLLLLLDGLDEVSEIYRADCLRAIPTQDFRSPGLIVCCRLDEYLKLPSKLALGAAICLQPLNPEQTEQFLDRMNLERLKQVARADLGWRDLLSSPFMLSIACHVFSSSKPDRFFMGVGSLLSEDDKRHALFRAYVERRFELRASAKSPWPRRQILHWLGWLAQNTLARSQREFLIDQLQPDLLPRGTWRWFYVIVSRLLVILSLTTRFLLPSPYTVSTTGILLFAAPVILSDGLAVTINTSLVGASITRRCVSVITHYALFFGMWNWLEHTRWDVGIGSDELPGYCALVFVVTGVLGGLRFAPQDIQPLTGVKWSWSHALFWTLAGATLGASIFYLAFRVGGLSPTLRELVGAGILGGLLGCALGSWAKRFTRETAVIPNQGIRSSLVSAMTFGACGSAVALPLILLLSSLLSLSGAPDPTAYIELALLFAFAYGGQEFVRHVVLRGLLAFRNDVPFRYVDFLKHCVHLGFLQASGSAFLFIHPTFQEYLAAERGDMVDRSDDAARSEKPRSS